MKTYDLAIIGAGPAGLTAAIYAGRYQLSTLVLGVPGGLATTAYKICNFPSQEPIKGYDFTQKIVKQVKDLGVEIKPELVKSIEQGKLFTIKTNSNTYAAKELIIATGTEKKKVHPDEGKFWGKGISYCATCDGPLYANKTVAIYGGRNSALTSALFLTELASKVYIIYRQASFKHAEPAWVDQVLKNKKITPIFNAEIKELTGKNNLETIKLTNNQNIEVDGLFIECGTLPKTELAKSLGVKLENGYIKTDRHQATNIKGVFAAGDVTNNVLKQIVVAAGEGAIAANSAYEEIKKNG